MRWACLMGRRVSARRVKSHRTYEIGEAAETVGVTPQTIRAWCKGGLRVMDARRPHLILGADLNEYLENARKKPGSSLPFGMLNCFGCKEPRKPAFGIVDYQPLSDRHGILAGFCEVCEGRCTRIVGQGRLPDWQALYEIGGSIGKTA